MDNNVILFPGWVRVSDGLWHGGRKYRHISIVKETISVKDWRRVYLWERWSRGYRDAARMPQQQVTA